MRNDGHCHEGGFSEPPDRADRLRVLCEAYGWSDLRQVVEAAKEFLQEDIDRIATLGPTGAKPWASFVERGLRRGQSGTPRLPDGRAGGCRG